MPFQPEGHFHWSPMRDQRIYFMLWLLVLMLAAGLRMLYLDRRPMHTDEAVHAVKFSELLQEGGYRYDAREYHGPTLYYFTLIPAWLRGQRTLASLDETTLRLVPLLFGLGMVLLPLLMTPFLGRAPALAAGFCVALSPLQVFYSRYYIQESLFLFFSALFLLCTGYYLRRRQRRWAVGAGAALGLLHATKETDLLILGAAALTLVVLWLPGHRRVCWPWRNLLAGMAMALVVAAPLLAGGWAHPGGLLESVRSYGIYFQRGAGDTLHLHPWYYYLRLLFWYQQPGGPWFSEIWIVPGLAAGLWTAWASRRQDHLFSETMRFISTFTLIIGGIYSALPYKTPWNTLAFEYGLLVIAGTGWVILFQMAKRWRVAVLIAGVMASGLMARQAWLLNGRYESDPVNPWVYAHPGAEVARISAAVEEAVLASPQGAQTLVQVAVTGDEYWPLPWTLRRLTAVGWYGQLDEKQPPAPLILISPDQEPALLRLLYDIPPPGKRDLYLPLWREYAELRPGREIRGYIRKDLYDRIAAGLQPGQDGTDDR